MANDKHNQNDNPQKPEESGEGIVDVSPSELSSADQELNELLGTVDSELRGLSEPESDAPVEVHESELKPADAAEPEQKPAPKQEPAAAPQPEKQPQQPSGKKQKQQKKKQSAQPAAPAKAPAEAPKDDVDALIEGMAADLHMDDAASGLRRETPAEQPAADPEKKGSALDSVKSKLKGVSGKKDGKSDEVYDPNEDYIFFRPRRKKRRRPRKKSRKLSCALVLLTLVISSGVVLAVAVLTVAMEIYGINKDFNERVITIPQGASTSAIAEQLKKEDMIELPWFFRLISRMNEKDGSYIAGEHVLSPSMSYQAMIEELCVNHAEEREYMTVTIPEGKNLLEAAEILEKNEICDADDFLFYFNAGGFGFNFEKYLPEANAMKFQQREGYCFPDTYEFYIDEDPQIVAQKIYANFDSKLTAGEYAKMEELGMTLDEVITLASIVQAEAANEKEMRMIAGIFHNRLINRAVFDKLQSDPTKKYAEEVIHPNLPVRNEMMEDAYNTYVGPGLPPGAIGNPGKAAIDAVLYPQESSYYYFYANVDTKVTYYAETYEQHLANIERVRQEQAAAAAAAEGN